MSNNNGLFFKAQFKIDEPPSSSALLPEHCRANQDQINSIGKARKQQVRIEYKSNGTSNRTIGAIYTVSTFHDDVELVSLGNRIVNLNNCQLSENACKGAVKAEVLIEGLKEEEAREKGEIIEFLSPIGQSRKLVVIAPHGGDIEPWTDVEAEYVWNHLSHDRVTLWLCKGFSNQGAFDALERWHITATEISPESFPMLNTIIETNPTFDYSVAFHGWKKDGICVGGSKNPIPADLRARIKNKIQEKLLAKGSDIQVWDADSPEGCPEGFNGDNDHNIVNKLGTNGIQIEQCREARDSFHDDIAQAVVDVLSPLINT